MLPVAGWDHMMHQEPEPSEGLRPGGFIIHQNGPDRQAATLLFCLRWFGSRWTIISDNKDSNFPSSDALS